LENENRYWHAIYVSSRQEKKVYEALILKGLESYLPLVKTMRQWSDRKKMVEMPLINGYVFLNVATTDYQSVYDTFGVVNFVRSEGKIAKIRAIEIERLKQLVDLGYQLEAESISRKYKEGDKVKITSGALMGIEGFVVSSNSGKNIEVLLESIGQCIRVKLPKEAFSLIEFQEA